MRYWVDVADGALHGCRDRPTNLHRFPDGVDGEGFYQKRLPKGAPDVGPDRALITFPSGRTRRCPVMVDAAHLAWAATLGCLEVNPWPVRADDVDHPDELRIDLDPVPDVAFAMGARRGAGGARRAGRARPRGVPEDQREARASTSTCGSSRDGPSPRSRRAALALAREIERRMPDLATTAWWKEERHGVFLDYNQNARDRTVASAYSVRPMPDARVSTPLAWDEVATVDPPRSRCAPCPSGCARDRGPGRRHRRRVGVLDALLDLAGTR